MGSVVREISRGDTLRLEITVTKNAVPLNLTGAKFWMTAKNSVFDADPGVFQLTSTPAAGITITNPSAGTAEAVVSAAQTSLVAQQNGGVSLVYDIKLKDSTGDVTTLESGTLKINPSPTGATS